jgi:hypothetical protein
MQIMYSLGSVGCPLATVVTAQDTLYHSSRRIRCIWIWFLILRFAHHEVVRMSFRPCKGESEKLNGCQEKAPSHEVFVGFPGLVTSYTLARSRCRTHGNSMCSLRITYFPSNPMRKHLALNKPRSMSEPSPLKISLQHSANITT